MGNRRGRYGVFGKILFMRVILRPQTSHHLPPRSAASSSPRSAGPETGTASTKRERFLPGDHPRNGRARSSPDCLRGYRRFLPEKHLALAQLSRDLLEIHCVVRSGCDEFGIAEELLHGLGCYSGRSVSTALEGFLHILHTVQSEPR